MCQYGTLRYINVNKRPESIPVDSCIAEEIEYLNKSGVNTLNCCCGHGTSNSSCLIWDDDIELCKTLGYEAHRYSSSHTQQGIYEIYLKTATMDYKMKEGDITP